MTKAAHHPLSIELSIDDLLIQFSLCLTATQQPTSTVRDRLTIELSIWPGLENIGQRRHTARDE